MEGAGARSRTLHCGAQPVTGGGETPVTPTRLVLHRLLAIGLKMRTPAFVTFTVCLTTPFWLERAVRILSFGPLIRTRMPLTGLPLLVTWIVSLVLRPTNSCFGEIRLTATQATGGRPSLT